MKVNYVGDGKVFLLSGGGKVYTDVAARIVASERSAKEIMMSEYSAKIVDNILKSGHLAATEFDNFLFLVEGYSRVCEVQLVRKRLASYLIKSGRVQLNGKREYSVVLPKSMKNDKACFTHIPFHKVYVKDSNDEMTTLFDSSVLTQSSFNLYLLNDHGLQLDLNNDWYDQMVEQGEKEQDLRYMKPQATEFRAIVGMNAHGLLDWFKIRLCKNAQDEIRDMAQRMFSLCKAAAPDLFKYAGPSCGVLGYCPEDNMMHPDCKKAGMYLPKTEALKVLSHYRIPF